MPQNKRQIKPTIILLLTTILISQFFLISLAKTEVYFSLYDNPQKEIIKNINQAEAFINIAMYIFTDREIALPLAKARFKSNSHKVIASANLIVIRPKENILGDYLKIFLESPVGSTLIKSFQRGSTIMNINPIDIKEIEIPILDLEKQREIAEHYSEEKRIFKETTEKAHKRWNKQKLFIYNRLWK